MAEYIHSTGLDVRDTDCDVQGIVAVHTGVEKKGELQLIFQQQITRESDGAVAAEAKVKTATLTKDGPVPTPPEFDAALAAYLSAKK